MSGDVAPQVVALTSASYPDLPAEVRAVMDSRQWAMVGTDACGGQWAARNVTTRLRFSFSQVSQLPAAFDLPLVRSYVALDAVSQGLVRGVLADVAAYADIAFTETDAATTPLAELQFRRAVPTRTDDVRSFFTTPAAPGAQSSAVMTLFRTGDRDLSATLRQQVGRMLGLAYPGLGLDATALDQSTDGFGDNVLSTAMSSNANPCWTPSMMGPLDRAVLAALYGPAPAPSGEPTLTITPQDPEVGGTALPAAPAGLVVVQAPQTYSWVSLRDDGVFASRVGDDLTLLAPGSVVRYADASQTLGASIFGSDGNDMLLGSAYDDAIDGFGGNDVVFTGAGSDWIIVPDGDFSLNITDFDATQDWLGFADEVPPSFSTTTVNDAAGTAYTALRWQASELLLGGTAGLGADALRARMRPQRFVRGVSLCQNTTAEATRLSHDALRTEVGRGTGQTPMATPAAAAAAPLSAAPTVAPMTVPAGPLATAPAAAPWSAGAGLSPTWSPTPAAAGLAAGAAGGIAGGVAALLVIAAGIGGYLAHRLRRRRALAPPLHGRTAQRADLVSARPPTQPISPRPPVAV